MLTSSKAALRAAADVFARPQIVHSLVVPFYNEIMYEVFHERVKDQMVPPKHIFNYWVKLEKDKFPETIRWIHPDYIDHTADGALIEYV